jgi:hypothetical protein
VIEDLRAHPWIQLGQRIIEQQHWWGTDRLTDGASLSQPQCQGHQPLLPARPEAPEIPTIELDDEIIAMRSHQRRATLDLIAKAPLERLQKSALRAVVAERSSIVERDFTIPCKHWIEPPYLER